MSKFCLYFNKECVSYQDLVGVYEGLQKRLQEVQHLRP